MSDPSQFHLKTPHGRVPRARIRWLPSEKYCRRYLSDGPWTQEHLDRIPFQTLGYYLTLNPFQAVYDNLQGRIQAKTLDRTMQYVAVGMLYTLQDTLGLGLTCPDAQGARSTAKWLPEPSECSFLSPQGLWGQQALNRVPGELSRFFAEPPCMETDKGLVYTLLGMRERALSSLDYVIVVDIWRIMRRKIKIVPNDDEMDFRYIMGRAHLYRAAQTKTDS